MQCQIRLIVNNNCSGGVERLKGWNFCFLFNIYMLVQNNGVSKMSLNLLTHVSSASSLMDIIIRYRHESDCMRGKIPERKFLPLIHLGLLHCSKFLHSKQ